jgi:CBS domain-containing protein
MPRIEKRSVLSGISVKEAMRRQVIQLPQSAAVDYCINRMIKYKINSVLIIDEKEQPAGVVSKTDVMSASVTFYREKDELTQVIEGLTAHHFGAVLIKNESGKAVGVVSKSDLIVAYKHGVAVDARAAAVMSKPVVSCDAQADLAVAIQQMLLRDVQRLFVHTDDPGQIVGILSLSDAARFRSGSCRACAPSRFIQT